MVPSKHCSHLAFPEEAEAGELLLGVGVEVEEEHLWEEGEEVGYHQVGGWGARWWRRWWLWEEVGWM